MNQSQCKSDFEVAADPQTPSEILDELADYDSTNILYAVLKNPNTSLKTLNKIADSGVSGFLYYYVRHYLSIHPNTNEELILKCRAQALRFRLNK